MIRRLKADGCQFAVVAISTGGVCGRVALFNRGRIVLSGTMPSWPGACSAAGTSSMSIARSVSAIALLRAWVVRVGAWPGHRVDCQSDPRRDRAVIATARGTPGIRFAAPSL
jgi:hypothetical protein